MYMLRFAKLWLTLGWKLIAIVALLSMWPERFHVIVSDSGIGGKLEHLIAYLVLMLWFANIYPQRSHRLWLSAGLIVIGVCLEFLQSMIPGRRFLYTDMMYSVVGVLIGLILAKTFLSTCLLHLDAWLIRGRQKAK